jgi:hypothetical protein
MTAFYVINPHGPIAVFSPQFLFDPPPGFSVDVDGADTETPMTLVTRHEPHRVWRLTGEVTDTGGLIARWPD